MLKDKDIREPLFDFFDYNYVVVGSSHSKHIDEHILLW